MKLIFFFIFLLFSFKTFFSQADNLKNNNLNLVWGKGVQNYQNKNYLQAKENFIFLMKKNPNNSDLLVNLGLIEYQLNHNGKALGYLRKALFISPYNESAKKTIFFISEKKQILSNQIMKNQDLLKIILNFILSIPLEIILIFNLLSFTILFIHLLKKIFIHQKINLEILNKNYLKIFNILFFTSTLFIILQIINYIYYPKATIINSTKIFLGPNEHFPYEGILEEGEEIIIKKVNNEWVQVKNKNIGWIKKSDLFQHSGINQW